MIKTILFAFLITDDGLVNPLIKTVLATLYLTLNYKKIKSWMLDLVSPLLVIIIIGFFNMQVFDYLFFKDLWYFLKPILFIIVGALFFDRNKKIEDFNTIIVVLGIIYSTIGILGIFSTTIGLEITFYQVTQNLDFHGNFLMIFSVIIIFFNKSNYNIKSIYYKIAIGLYLLAIPLLTASRTLIISFIIMLLILKIIKFKRLILVLILASVLLISIQFVKTDILIIEKFRLAITELTVSRANYGFGPANFGNWRGYETFLALDTFSAFNSIPKYLFGGGFGTVVELGFYMNFEDNVQLNFLPVFHNGFLTLLLKVGVIGLIFYLFFFYRLVRNVIRKSKNDNFFERRFLLGISINALIGTFVVSGLYNKSIFDSTLILFGLYTALIIKTEEPTLKEIKM